MCFFLYLGEWKWIDGTECTVDTGLCTDLWDSPIVNDNYDDFNQLVPAFSDRFNSDCGAFATWNFTFWDEDFDGSAHLELACNRNAIPLCNAPEISPYTDGRRYKLVIKASFDGNEANDLCQETYGTDLATIIDEDDQANAVIEFNLVGANTAYIGLRQNNGMFKLQINTELKTLY